jgi:putative SOS response-associated peptidase YedK
MCGRFTYRLTWPELVRLYRLTLDAPARNTQPRYNICPTTNIDTVIERDEAANCGDAQRKTPPTRGLLICGLVT